MKEAYRKFISLSPTSTLGIHTTLDIVPRYELDQVLCKRRDLTFFEMNETFLLTFTKTSSVRDAICVAMCEKVEALESLSQIAKKYVDELEPFMATLQVLVEEELAPLREKATELDVEEAKVLQGSVLELR